MTVTFDYQGKVEYLRVLQANEVVSSIVISMERFVSRAAAEITRFDIKVKPLTEHYYGYMLSVHICQNILELKFDLCVNF